MLSTRDWTVICAYSREYSTGAKRSPLNSQSSAPLMTSRAPRPKIRQPRARASARDQGQRFAVGQKTCRCRAMRLPDRSVIARVTSSVHGSDYMFSAHHKKKRLREGGVGPEICSPVLLVRPILRRPQLAGKTKHPTCAAVLRRAGSSCYIDGFNLFFGLRSKGWRKYYWLDLARRGDRCAEPLICTSPTRSAARTAFLGRRFGGLELARLARLQQVIDSSGIESLR